MASLSSSLVIISSLAGALLLVAGQPEAGDPFWSHGDQEAWPESYPSCGGDRQSPIDIDTAAAESRPDLKLELINYELAMGFKLSNDDTTVGMGPVPPTGARRSIVHASWLRSAAGGSQSSYSSGARSPVTLVPASEAGISGRSPTVRASWQNPDSGYELVNIHLHWSEAPQDGAPGSEHAIDGYRTAAEMHLVHVPIEMRDAEPGAVPESVIVVGVMIEPRTDGSLSMGALDRILAPHLSMLNATKGELDADAKPPTMELLPKRRHFYTYQGSLTTPPCSEIVTWVVMREPIYVQPETLAQLASMQGTSEAPRPQMAPNDRQLQPLAGRTVWASAEDTATGSGLQSALRKSMSGLNGALGRMSIKIRQRR